MQGKSLLSGNSCVDLRLCPRCSHSNSLIAGPYPINEDSLLMSLDRLVLWKMYKLARKLLSGKCEALHLQIEEAYSQHFNSKNLLGH
jgi:hypothetical protein